MKKEKLSHYAQVLASHADAHWVSPVFFLLFFIDSFIMVIPGDSLLSATVSLRPRNLKKWFLFSALGAAGGFGLLVFLGHTIFHDYLMKEIHEEGFYSKVGNYLEHFQHYGLWELAAGVFTLVPCMVAALAGVVVGLNPWAVWAVVMAAKLVRMAMTVWVVHLGRPLVKKVVSLYLKTNV